MSPVSVRRSLPVAGRSISTPSSASNSPMIVTSTMSGTFCQFESAIGEKRGRHQLENRVLSARHIDRSANRSAAAHHEILTRQIRIHTHQYAPPVRPGGTMVTQTWPNDAEHIAKVEQPRDDLVLEVRSADDDAVYVQKHGPFSSYQRVIKRAERTITETTTYQLTIPWFGWAVQAAGRPGDTSSDFPSGLLVTAGPPRHHTGVGHRGCSPLRL